MWRSKNLEPCQTLIVLISQSQPLMSNTPHERPQFMKYSTRVWKGLWFISTYLRVTVFLDYLEAQFQLQVDIFHLWRFYTTTMGLIWPWLYPQMPKHRCSPADLPAKGQRLLGRGPGVMVFFLPFTRYFLVPGVPESWPIWEDLYYLYNAIHIDIVIWLNQ